MARDSFCRYVCSDRRDASHCTARSFRKSRVLYSGKLSTQAYT